MPLSPFDYAILRVVPRVDREEFINVGVLLFCRTRSFLGARVALDRERLQALSLDVDVDEAEEYLMHVEAICRGDADAGPIAELSLSGRFHWLTSPRSTIIQSSAMHSGLSANPEQELDRIFRSMVLR